MGNDLERLASLVLERRTELRLGIEPAAKLAGMSKDTWKRVEAAQTVRATSYTGIEAALQWAPGSCRRILSGAAPVVLQPSEAVVGRHVADIPKSEIERAVGDAVTSAAMSTKGSLTADEILELNARVLKELRERGVI